MSLIGGGSDDSGGPTRKTHIKRIYKDDDPDSGIWIDIERIDELTYESGVGFAQQTKVWTFDWADFDPDGDGVTKKKIKDPNDSSSSGNGGSDGSDDGSADSSASVVLVPVRDKITVTQGTNNQYQEYTHFFVNDNTNTSRSTHSRRVYHYDVPDDQLDENKNPPRDPQDYLNALGDKDSSQYLEVEILDSFTTNENENRDSHGQIKPSVWQEKEWLVDSAGDVLLQDRDGDTSKDFATKNPTDGVVDPPWRLDPLQNIVNVGFGGEYKLVVILQGLNGEPQSVIKFTVPKAFFTSSELKGGKLKAPVFGEETDVDTNTISMNGTYSIEVLPGSGFFTPSTVSGDQVMVSQPDVFIDYRGYISLYTTEGFVNINEIGQPTFGQRLTGNKFYFDYKGNEIGAVPRLSKTALTKGLAVASDEDGTVYVRSFWNYSDSRSPDKEGAFFPRSGLTKYDNNGSILWAAQRDADSSSPLLKTPNSANYDTKTGLITLVLSAIRIVETWNLRGENTSSTITPTGYDIQAVSRKGKMYAISPTGGLAAFSSANGDINKLWENAPPDPEDFQLAETAAFGEDYVIVAELKSEFSHIDNTVHDPDTDATSGSVTQIEVDNWRISVYDAKDGKQVDTTFWGTNETEITTPVGGVTEFDRENDQESYATVIIPTSNYFP